MGRDQLGYIRSPRYSKGVSGIRFAGFVSCKTQAGLAIVCTIRPDDSAYELRALLCVRCAAVIRRHHGFRATG